GEALHLPPEPGAGEAEFLGPRAEGDAELALPEVGVVGDVADALEVREARLDRLGDAHDLAEIIARDGVGERGAARPAADALDPEAVDAGEHAEFGADVLGEAGAGAQAAGLALLHRHQLQDELP